MQHFFFFLISAKIFCLRVMNCSATVLSRIIYTDYQNHFFFLLEELQKVLFEQIDLRRRLEQEFQVLKGNASFPVFSKTQNLCFWCFVCVWLVVARLIK